MSAAESPRSGPDGLGRVASDAEIRAAVGRARREVADDIASGTVPASVRDTDGLHDHVDANTYGGICDDDGPTFSYWDGTAVLAYVDAWMEAGRPDGLPPMSEYLRGHLAEQGRAPDAALVQP